MEDYSVTVTGFPATLNKLKLHLFLEKHIGQGLIEKVEKRGGGLVLFKFNSAEGLQNFHEANVKEIQFGGEIHKLVILDDIPEKEPQQTSDWRKIDLQRDTDTWRRQLHVRNIPEHIRSRRVFMYHFEKFGNLERVSIKEDGSYGWLTFSRHEDALAAKYGGVNAGPSHHLYIQWDFKEVPPSGGHERPPLLPTPVGHDRAPRRTSGDGDNGPRSRPRMPAAGLGSGPKPRPMPKKSVTETDEAAMFNQIHYWSSLKELPAPEGTVCVLAQGIDPSSTLQKLKLHFESKKRANGGPVKSITGMVDGLLIVFQESEDCETCLKMKSQKLDGKDLKIYEKKIPTYFERKFVVEGIGANTTSDTLTMFLESCSVNETSPECCKEQEASGVYLIEYGVDFDQVETAEILTKIQSKGALEGRPLKASRLLRTDCLKVIGVQSNVSTDEIKLKFESKKRTDGGPVTRIDRFLNKVVLVYFASFTVTERVYERFKKPCAESIVLGERPVEVELYFHALASDHKNGVMEPPPTHSVEVKEEPPQSYPGQPIQIYEFQPACDEKILNFISLNKIHLDKIKEGFTSTASVQICTKKKQGSTRAVKFTPHKNLAFETQDQFNADCRMKIEAFLSGYSTTNFVTDRTKLQRGRSSNVCSLLDKDFKGDLLNVSVNWKNNSVDVTGVEDNVNKMVEDIKNSLEFITEKMPIISEQYRMMQACGVIEELQQKHPKVNIKCDDRSEEILITGQLSDIHDVKFAAVSILHTIEKKKLTGLDETIVQFLSEMLRGSPEVKSAIQNKFKQEKVNAAIGMDGDEPCLRVRSQNDDTRNDYKNAIAVIKKLIKIRKIETDEAANAVVTSRQWKSFHQGLQGPFKVYIKRRECILMVGMETELQMVHKKISDFLDENAKRRVCLNMPYGSARFIVEKSVEFSNAACEKEGIQCGLTADDGGGVFVEGKKKSLDKARSQMQQIVQRITEVPCELRETGINHYYDGQEGKEFLKTTGNINNCIILVSSRTCPEWENEKQRQIRQREEVRTVVPQVKVPKKEVYASVKLPKSQISLQVWKTNIIEHDCDAIVNASNPEMLLLNGGISGVIKKIDDRAGGRIQKEMKQLIVSNHGDFVPGDAAITSAGNLSSCKKIVHAVGPRWNNATEKNASLSLKSCILKSLEEASRARMTSIAFPAISCGIFGGKIDICAPLIVEAVVEYFLEETTSSLTRVDFVENTEEEILIEFKKCVETYASTEEETKVQPPTANPQPSASSSSYAATSSSPIVQLVQGDIAAMNADVIVNVTSAQGFTNMQGSAVSKALLRSGGASISQECAQTPGPHNIGSVFETNAGALNCRRLYHAIVSNYNKNSGKVIQSIVSKCLKMADKSGYSTIVFPAIATGGFRHPPAIVAQLMRQEIDGFSAVNLKNVTIALYPQSQANADFQAEFSGAPRPSTANPGPKRAATQRPSSSQAAGNFGPIKVKVYQGDITQEKSDAIVNSTNSSFDLSQGLVSNAIIAQGGNQIQPEVLNGSGTDFRISSGGHLPCGKIFHIVTPESAKDISKKMLLILKEADKRAVTSISFPALGTGNIGLNSSSVAHIMRRTFEEFAKSGVKSLTTINVVVFDTSMVNDFKKEILNPDQKSFFGKMKDTWNSWFSGSEASEHKNLAEDIFTLYFYSTEVNDINKAIECVAKENKKMTLSKVINEEAFQRFSDWEKWEMNQVEIKRKVKIVDHSNRYLQQFKVEGLTNDVYQASEDISEILKEFTAAEITASYVTWEKLVNGQWEDYQPRTANTLEKAYKVRNGNNTDHRLNNITIEEYRDGRVRSTTVDLSNLEGGNGPNPPTIKRRVVEGGGDDVIPSSWTDMQGSPYLKVPLNQTSQEYVNAHNMFTNTGGPGTIIKIERIQNESLYKQYAAKKAEVQKKMNASQPVERQLFHGTDVDDKIIAQGFDRSFAGKNATAHGRGVYFAINASYSHNYAPPNPQGQRRMFVADVITGDYCQGSSSYVAPPVKPGTTKNDLYDSVVNNINAPSIFVIFKDASAYPTYLITYL